MPRPLPGTRALVAFFATFLVVGGVVGVTYIAQPVVPRSEAPSPKSRTTDADVGRPPIFTFLITDQSGSRLFANGENRGLAWPDDVKLLGQPLSTITGWDGRSGEGAYLQTGFLRATSSVGIRSPDGRRSLHAAPARRDKTGVVEVHTGSESLVFVMRLPNGRGIRDVIPLGWWDDDTMAVMGRVTSSRAIFAVSVSNKLRQIGNLTDAARHFRMQGGELWYVTVTEGKGLEDPDGPPASLRRMNVSGIVTTVQTEEKTVIGRYAADDAFLAYQNDADDAVRISLQGERTEIPLGKGAPLVILPDGRVLMSRENKVFIKDPITGREDPVADIGDGAAVFFLPKATVDEIAETT